MERCAVLDDYQDVALAAADWSVLRDVEVTSFTEHTADQDALVALLESFEIVVAMRERTPFPASSSDPPVELTWALILALSRHVTMENAALRTNGAWQSTVGRTLRVPVSVSWAWARSGPRWPASGRRSACAWRRGAHT